MLLGTGTGSGQGSFQPQTSATPQALPQATEAAPQPTEAASPDASAVAAVLSAQTGLSADELTTQLSGGSTIAQLVSAHGGDLQAVTDAIKAALDSMAAAGGREAGMISRLGSDTTSVAEQIVQGQLPEREQQFVVAFLVTGALPQFGGNGGAGGGSFTPPNGSNGGNNGNDSSAVPLTATTPDAPVSQPEMTRQNASVPVDPTQEPATVTPVPYTPPPTSVEQRPTQIVFPTASPTLEAPETTSEATSQTANTTDTASGAANATCTLVTNYNLNLRDKPGKDGSIVLLSIPMGTVVTAARRTADGWYSVSYDGHDGWVTSEYAGVSDGCARLPTG
jgi:hypothetical protein